VLHKFQTFEIKLKWKNKEESSKSNKDQKTRDEKKSSHHSPNCMNTA